MINYGEVSFSILSPQKVVQDINLNQVKLKANETFQQNEKVTTNFESSNDQDVVSKNYPHTKLSKVECHLSFIVEDYNENKLRSNK